MRANGNRIKLSLSMRLKLFLSYNISTELTSQQWREYLYLFHYDLCDKISSDLIIKTSVVSLYTDAFQCMPCFPSIVSEDYLSVSVYGILNHFYSMLDLVDIDFLLQIT